MSEAKPTAPVPGQQSLIKGYRDDGPLATLLGDAFGPRVALAPLVLVVVAAAPLTAAIVLGGSDVPQLTVAAVVAWLVVIGGLSQGRPHADRFAWAVPALLRSAEYGGLVWFAALAGSDAIPGAFALLAALAFRHYDIVYRLRYQGVAPPEWVGLAAGGWEGRLLAGLALFAAGALPAGFFVAAALLGILFVGESVAGWTRLARAQRPELYAEAEGEAE